MLWPTPRFLVRAARAQIARLAEGSSVTTNLNTAYTERRESFWFKIGQALLLVALAVAVYILVLSMVHNRFFQGGHMDRHGHISR